MAKTAVPTDAATAPDQETQEKLLSQIGELLAGAPPSLVTEEERLAAANKAAEHYDTPVGREALDPEDNLMLVQRAFAAIGRPIPPEIAAAAAARQQPVVLTDPANVNDANTGVLDAAKALERQADILRRHMATARPSSDKKAAYEEAIRNSPVIQYYNREQREMMVNRVAIGVPKGLQALPLIIVKEIEQQDRHRDWAERARKYAQQMMNIDPTPATGFQEKKITAFTYG